MAKKRGKKGDIWHWKQSYSDGECIDATMLLLDKRDGYDALTKKKVRWIKWLVLETGAYVDYAEKECFMECWDEPCGSDGLTNTETWEQVG